VYAVTRQQKCCGQKQRENGSDAAHVRAAKVNFGRRIVGIFKSHARVEISEFCALSIL
jgi:hypothetical protein